MEQGTLFQLAVARVLVVAVSLLAAASTPQQVAGRGWIVSGSNKSSTGVPVCSYCINVLNPKLAKNLRGAAVSMWRCSAFKGNEASWEYHAANNSIQMLDYLGQTLCLDAGAQDSYDGQVSIVSPFLVDACNSSRPEQQWFLSEGMDSGAIRSGLKSPSGHDLYMVQGRLPPDSSMRENGYFSLYLSTEVGFSAAPFMSQQFTFQSTANYVSGLSLREWDSEEGANLVHNGGFERCTLLGTPATPPSYVNLNPGELFPLCGWGVRDGLVPATWISTRFPNGFADAQSNSSILLSSGAAINQTIPTHPDFLYSLSLSVAGYLSWSPNPRSLSPISFEFCSNEALQVRVELSCKAADVVVSSVSSFFRVRQPSEQVDDAKWFTETANFTCFGGNQTEIVISTEGSFSDLCGPVIDNVIVLELGTKRTSNGTNSSARRSSGGLSRVLVLLVTLAALGLVLLGALVAYHYRSRWYGPVLQLSPEADGRVRVFSVGQILKATKNLSPEYLLGEGGFGSVYKAHFTDGVMGAVKVEKASSMASKSSLFAEEVALLQRVHHRNLVNLIGLCVDGGTRMLVFEYLPNGNLSDRLHSAHSGLEPLTWLSRMKIVYQVACALDYLHHGTSPPIVHRDVKSANILLTCTDTAKLADFGLSKAAPADATHFSSVHTAVKGSFGYLDPHYIRSGVCSSKSDVYSYGVVVLELITGHRAIKDGNLLSEWALEQLQDNSGVYDIIDLHVVGECNAADLFILLDLVKGCLQDDAQSRPTMQQVVCFLNERDFSGIPGTATPSEADKNSLFTHSNEQDDVSFLASFSAEHSNSMSASTFYQRGSELTSSASSREAMPF